MSPSPLLAILGVTFLLPSAHTLSCQWGTIEVVRNVSGLPLQWTTSQTECELNEGCQETLLLVENGPQVNLVLSKGCTTQEDQEAKVTEHRAGPGLSITSYTRVCRHGDFCNDLSSTVPLWTSPSDPVPGSLRCALCFSNGDCPENAPQHVCPAGFTHCYKGVLKLRGGGIATNLRVQGCMPQPGCNLLNGTQVIGSLDVSENCSPRSGMEILECKKGNIETTRDVSDLPVHWTTGWQACGIGEGCQETVVLIVNGPQVNVVINKGCTKAQDQEPRVTWHRAGPGLSVVSYTRVCRHRDFCNDLSTTEAFWTPPASEGARVPGSLLCPACLSTNDCPENAPQQICPAGYTHCYNGVVSLRGGGIFTHLRVQGCMPQPGCNLFNGTQKIGPIRVSEKCNSKSGAHRRACNWGTLQTVRDASELPLKWTAGEITCDVGDGCQETVMLIKNGPQVNLVLSKGCTTQEDQEAKVTEHRAGPGLSITSYTRVCRHGDFCNDLSSTVPLWTSPSDPVPGSLRCALCFSNGDCPENAPQHVCPAGFTHCYKGVLKLRGGGIATNLRVQGCMPQPGCNLLNGTQVIGSLDVSENCSPRSGMEILECKKGNIETTRDVSDLPVHWTTGWQACGIGEGCQETVVLIVNGPQVNVVINKGCTKAQDQEPRVTWHRAGPGLSVVSYTRVCRHRDFCNDLSTTEAFWTPPASEGARVPGSLLCPACLSTNDCPENAPQQICPAGYTHCYNGVVRLGGGGIATNLRVQGCMPQPGCNLLNGTQVIGSLDVSENCSPRAAILTCNRGIMLQIETGLSQEPREWTTSVQENCKPGEVCQETLLLIDVGHKALLAASKGCSSPQRQDAPTVLIHSGSPGVLVASYAWFCSSILCNSAKSSSVLLDSLPRPAAPAPGSRQCPICVNFGGSCSQDSNFITCPNGTNHCYKGKIYAQGGGLSATLGVQGCMPESSRSLLNEVQKIGIFSVKEDFEGKMKEYLLPNRGAPTPYLAWVVGLGLSVALWCGVFSSLLNTFFRDP